MISFNSFDLNNGIYFKFNVYQQKNQNSVHN